MLGTSKLCGIPTRLYTDNMVAAVICSTPDELVSGVFGTKSAAVAVHLTVGGGARHP
jgi:hypothetical protein